MKILNYGSCNIDYVYGVDHTVRAGETLSADSLALFAGGKGLNQSIALARAGAAVYHAGCIGEDGDMLRRTLAESGVDVSYLKTAAQQSGHAIIQLDKSGENCIIVYRGTNGAIEKEDIDRVLSHFGAGDFLVLQNEINNTDYLIEAAAARGLLTVFNPSPFSPELKALPLDKLAYLILNETEAQGFFGTCAAEKISGEIARAYPRLRVVLTLGSRGSCYIESTGCTPCPAFSVPVVDTTAAGDTFTGFLVAEISAGKSPAAAMEIASAAAALAVSKKGAAPSIPLMKEVLDALPTLKRRA